MKSKMLLIGQRLLLALPVLLGVVIISFLLTRALPGDPAVYFAGAMADEESIQFTREKLGLDKSLLVQFFAYSGRLVQGDFGYSLTTGQTVLFELGSRLPASLELTLLGLSLSLIIAIPLGILAAMKPNSWVDHVCRLLVTAGVSMPIFFTGLFLVYIFYYLLDVAPSPIGRLDFLYLPPPHVTGFFLIDSLLVGDWELFGVSLHQIMLPSITLAIFALAPIARITRGAMLVSLGSEYVKAATANGLPKNIVVIKYAFRNALLPLLTTLGMVFSFLLGANVLVEKVFAWPGIGSFAIEALVASDYAAVQGFVLTMAFLFIFINLLIDLVHTLIDPRVGSH
ncbi:MAG: peptide/nickel transport system permease protein [Candidatus Endobugula sp.]|jgi:peptide/nickel transport system permease protein